MVVTGGWYVVESSGFQGFSNSGESGVLEQVVDRTPISNTELQYVSSVRIDVLSLNLFNANDPLKTHLD